MCSEHKPICLLNDNTIETAHSVNNYKIIASQIIQSLLFQKSISLIDGLTVNSPAFRVALQKIPTLLEAIVLCNPTIYLDFGYESLKHKRDALFSAEKHHPELKKNNTLHHFLTNDDLNKLDKKEFYKPLDYKKIGKTFTYNILSAFNSSYAKERIPIDICYKIIDALQEIRKDNPHGLLGQADFERASRPSAPLEKKLGADWALYEAIIFKIERAFYSSSIGETENLSTIYAPEHHHVAEVRGKAITEDDPSFQPIQIASPYLTHTNLLKLSPDFFYKLRERDEFSEWILVVDELKTKNNDTSSIKEVNKALKNYLLFLNSQIQENITDKKEDSNSILKLLVTRGTKTLSKALNTTSEILSYTSVPGCAIYLSTLAGLEINPLVSIGIEQFISLKIKSEVIPAIEYSANLIDNSSVNKELVNSNDGIVKATISIDKNTKKYDDIFVSTANS